ncbi:MAG: hypothetical protein ACRD0Z_13205 [Acidimicrobiales bacterium]
MLLAGTTRNLWNLDASYSIAEDVGVCALATSSGHCWALLDGSRIDRIGEFDLSPVCDLGAADGQSLAAMPSGSLIVGRTGARLALVPSAGDAPRALDSFDVVQGRDEWENPAGPTPDLRSLASDAGGRLYVNVHVGGLWLSDDEGDTWSASIEPVADVHEVTTSDGTVAVAAAGGFGWSTDRGASWNWTEEGLHASYCRAVALDGEVAYVTASTGPSTNQAAVYRCAHLGEPFVKLAGGLPEWFTTNVDTSTLAAKDGVVAIGTRDGNVWRSLDGGTTFDKIAFELGPVTTVLLA